MTYLEHKELADRLRHEATQALHESVKAAERFYDLNDTAADRHGKGLEAGSCGEWLRCIEERDAKYAEYVRLSKLSNKHMGIYRMVMTQRAEGVAA